MLFTGFFLRSSIPMFNVSWGWLYTHSRWSVSRYHTHDGHPICWCSFPGAVILMLHGQCVTQVARGGIVIIVDWCLCDFLVLKHIHEVHTLHLHLSFTDVDIFLCQKMFQNFNIVFDYLLILTFFHVQNVLIIFDWCLCDFLVLKHIHEVHTLHLHLSLTNVEMFSCCKFSRISILFWIIYWCWLFLCANCSHHFWLMFMWFSCTETYRWSVCTSSSLVIYWCWLFFMCKMFLSFSTDVYVIFLYQNISMEYTHFIFICHLLMLTYFCVENVPQFQYCFWLFTDVDYFSCTKCSYHVLIIFQNFNIAFDYLLMLTIFHVPKFL